MESPIGNFDRELKGYVNSQTGYSHNCLMLSREVNISTTVMVHPPPYEAAEEKENGCNTDQYVQDLGQKLRKAHGIVRTKPKTAQQVMMRDDDVRVQGRFIF